MRASLRLQGKRRSACMPLSRALDRGQVVGVDLAWRDVALWVRGEWCAGNRRVRLATAYHLLPLAARARGERHDLRSASSGAMQPAKRWPEPWVRGMRLTHVLTVRCSCRSPRTAVEQVRESVARAAPAAERRRYTGNSRGVLWLVVRGFVMARTSCWRRALAARGDRRVSGPGQGTRVRAAGESARRPHERVQRCERACWATWCTRG